MNEEIHAERKVRLENFLRKFDSFSAQPHLVYRRTRTLMELYVSYLKAADPEWPSSTITLNRVFKRQNNFWMHMYVHGPVQRRIDEALKSLRACDYAATERALESLASEHGGREIASEIQSHNSSHKHKRGAYEKLLEDMVKADPKIGHKETERLLQRQVGKGVIDRIDDSLGEIVLNDGRVFKISGLKDMVYRIRTRI